MTSLNARIKELRSQIKQAEKDGDAHRAQELARQLGELAPALAKK